MRGLPVIAVVLALLVSPSTPTSARDADAEARGATGPAGKFYGYLTPVITISKGDALTFDNLDLDRHNIVQDVEADGEGGPSKARWCKETHSHHDHGDACPLFWSKLIGFQESSQVKGLKRVKAGETYTFFCTLHHGMKGNLVVLP